MSFKDLIGNSEIKEILKRTRDRVGNAYLFIGPESIGKRLFAINFAKLLNCLDPERDGEPCEKCSSCKKINSGNHPDFRFIAPDKTQIKISQIRETIKFTIYKRYEGKYRIIIIDDAHAMNKEASNALLKVLEEPTENTVFILVTSNPLGILPTIKSRCQRIRFKKPALNEIKDYLGKIKNYKEKELDLIAKISGKNFSIATDFNMDSYNTTRAEIINFINNVKKNRFVIFEGNAVDLKEKENVLNMLDFLIMLHRDVLFHKEGIDKRFIYNSDMDSVIEKYSESENVLDLISKLTGLVRLKNDLINTNINAELAVTNMLLYI